MSDKVGEPRQFTWKEFHDWYYSTIIGRPDIGWKNKNKRRGDQSHAQPFFDRWRSEMGANAPFTDVDQLMYDQLIPEALSDVKIESEETNVHNQKAIQNLAERAILPFYEFRYEEPIITVTPLWLPNETTAIEQIRKLLPKLTRRQIDQLLTEISNFKCR